MESRWGAVEIRRSREPGRGSSPRIEAGSSETETPCHGRVGPLLRPCVSRGSWPSGAGGKAGSGLTRTVVSAYRRHPRPPMAPSEETVRVHALASNLLPAGSRSVPEAARGSAVVTSPPRRRRRRSWDDRSRRRRTRLGSCGSPRRIAFSGIEPRSPAVPSSSRAGRRRRAPGSSGPGGAALRAAMGAGPRRPPPDVQIDAPVGDSSAGANGAGERSDRRGERPPAPASPRTRRNEGAT